MITCPVCKSENNDGDLFCQDCGSRLTGPTAAVPPPIPPVPVAPPAIAPAAIAPAPAPAPAEAVGESLGAPAAPSAVPPAPPAEAPAPAVGVPAPVVPGAPIVCPNCQTVNDADFRFCKGCGTPLTAAAAPAATPPAPVAPTGPRLVVTSDPGKGLTFPLGATTNVGRLPGNEIVLSNDSYVSSHHAVITQEADGFYLADKGSTNGTYVQIKQRLKLAPGDVVKIGDTNLEFNV